MSSPSLPALTPGDWKQVRAWFDRAVQLPEAERAGWLEALDAPPLLQATLHRMLAADAETEGMLDQGIAEAAHLALEPETVLPPGTAVGDFDVVGELGRGGMGIVYAARDRHLDRPVALKLVRAGVAKGGDETQRLLMEAKAASSLDHPNVATIYQVGQGADGRYFIAMPRYDGETLRARLDRGQLPPDEAHAIARSVASGLAAAHRAGLVHGDVTAGNIFLTADGSVKLLDFGLATFAGGQRESDLFGGTIRYLSPEQARGESASPRSDVWGLSVVLYRMLTGRFPFEAESAAGTLASISGPEPAPRLRGRAGVPRHLASVVDRALHKDQSDRFADAREFEQALLRNTPGRRRVAGIATVAMLLVVSSFMLRLPAAPDGAANDADAPPTVALLPLRDTMPGTPHTELVTALLDDVHDQLSMLGRVRLVDGYQADGVAPDWHVLELAITGPTTSPSVSATMSRPGEAAPVRSESRLLALADVRELTRWLDRFVLAGAGVTLTAGEDAALAGRLPSSIEAYREFLSGNSLLDQRTPASVLGAIQRYRRAQRLDSAYVSAIAREAYAISLMLDWGWPFPGESRSDALARGIELSQRALALDSTSAESWLARGYLLVARDPHRLAGAPEAFRRAIALDPYNAEAFHQYGQAEMVLGRWTEAMRAYRRAIELHPGSGMTLLSMGGIAELQENRSESLRLLDSAVAVAPNMAFARAIRSHIRAMAGDADGAMADARAALAMDPDYQAPALSALAAAAWISGDTAAAAIWMEKTLGAFLDPSEPSPDETELAALAALAMGRSDLAIGLLGRARPRGATLWYLFQHPAFAELRQLPEVGGILHEADPRRPAGS